MRLYAADPTLEVAWAKGRPVPTSISGMLRGPDPRDPETIAREFLRGNAGLFGIRSVDEELRSNLEDSDLRDPETGWSMVRFDQVLASLPVVGHSLGVNVDADGRTRSVHGRFAAGLDPASVPSSPSVDAVAVEQALRADLGGYAGAFDVFSVPELAVASQEGAAVLVWRTTVVSLEKGAGAVYLVDATTGGIHARISTTCSNAPTYESVSGSGSDPQGNSRSLRLGRYYLNGVTAYGDYYLDDQSRDGRIRGYDDSGNLSSWSTSGILTDSNGTWSGERTDQNGEVAGQYNLGKVLDYYSSYHSRNSWDRSGGDVSAAYHAGNVSNATSFGSGRIAFGDGASGRLPHTSLNTCGHEFTHSVLHDEGIDSDDDENGAIHESMGDVFGCFVERVYGNATTGGWNFQHGEDTYSGASGYVRDLQNPTRDHYSEFVAGGDTHTNGEILNYAMYLVWRGGTHPDSDVAVSGIDFTATRKIYYKAVRSYLSGSASPSFYDLRVALSSAASELYGSSSSERTTIQKAFTAVGITAHNFDVIEWANDFDTWTTGSASVPFNSPNVWPGVWYPKYELEDGTAAPTAYGEQLAMLPPSGAWGYTKGSFPIRLAEVSGSSEPRLKVRVGFKERTSYSSSSCYTAMVGVYFQPADGGTQFTWYTEISYDGTMDTANENLSSWAGKSGTLYVWVLNESEKVSLPIVWDQLEISYE